MKADQRNAARGRRGRLTEQDLARSVRSENIDTVLLVFTDHYGRFMGKRLDADFFLDHAVKEGTHACDYLLTVDMEMDPVPGYRFANWEKGYGDVHLVPDLSTLRRAAWLNKSAIVICDVAGTQSHESIRLAPRTILRNQVESLSKRGFSAMGASELEYYIFQNSYRDASAKGYAGLQPAGWYLEDYHMLQGAREENFNGAARRHLKNSGVPVENSKGEWGLGQHELNIRFAEVLEMADRHAIFKQCLKETADAMGISVTFMAKFAANQAGSSCHIHLSLWKNGRNVFPAAASRSMSSANAPPSLTLPLEGGGVGGGDPTKIVRKAPWSGEKVGPARCSDVFRWFLGGWIAHAPEVMVFYAPTVNSYKRYQAASWAPTRLAWSYDNRTAGFRVVGAEESLRIECRIAGADCNPYLAYAAALASGLDGIVNKIEPPPMFEGDAYAAKKLPRVPGSLREATDLFEKSAFVKAAFGPDVVEHYAHFFRTEQEAFNRAVTDWERVRYFERI